MGTFFFLFLKVGRFLMLMLEDAMSEVCCFHNYERFQPKPTGTLLV